MSDKKRPGEESLPSSASDKSRKKTANPFKGYVITVIAFTVIALVLMIFIAFSAINPVTEIVHKVENQLNMQVRDIEADGDYTPDNSNDNQFVYGRRFADIVCENTGLNCGVYYGANRASMRYGAGMDTNTAYFAEGDVTVIEGYDSTYFSSLKETETGDILTVTTDDKVYKYEVFDTAVVPADKQAYDSAQADTLVLYSVFSDFSENSNSRFYVYAKLIDSAEVK